MARRAAAVDANQTEIVAALRKAGASVAITSGVHSGFPDIVAGFRGVNYLIEIKDGKKPPSKQALTSDQVEFHAAWRGQIAVARTVEEAFEIIGVRPCGR
jgi:Holliday junction resolvase